MNESITKAIVPALIGGFCGLAGGIASSYGSFKNAESENDILYARLAVEMLTDENLNTDKMSRKFAVDLFQYSTGVYVTEQEAVLWVSGEMSQ